MRRAAAVLIALVALTAAPAGAGACSRFVSDPRADLAAADVAVIGTVESRRNVDPSDERPQAVLTVRIEQVLKGAPGERLEVMTSAMIGTCGITAATGARIGVMAALDGSQYHSLFGDLSPEVLIEAAAPLPPPDGSGPPAVLLGARVGPNRMLVLDRRGRVLLYGAGPGRVLAAAGCPGGRYGVEVVIDREGRGRLERRDLRSGRHVLLARLPLDLVEATVCRTRDASVVDVGGAANGYARLVRVQDGRARLRLRMRGTGAWLGGPTAAVTKLDGTVVAVDVASGRRRAVGVLDTSIGFLDVAADGRIVLASASGGVDVHTPEATRTYDLDGPRHRRLLGRRPSRRRPAGAGPRARRRRRAGGRDPRLRGPVRRRARRGCTPSRSARASSSSGTPARARRSAATCPARRSTSRRSRRSADAGRVVRPAGSAVRRVQGFPLVGARTTVVPCGGSLRGG